jgi:NTP pyrophosphatase (non-canonical NTP hydrolase)
MNKLTVTPERISEAMGILQEECAEVIVEVSKCRRFGLNSLHYKTGIKHSTMLEMEIGDVLAMIDILVEQGVIDRNALEVASEEKKRKLHMWSSIYNE